jgi:hypothetical protein
MWNQVFYLGFGRGSITCCRGVKDDDMIDWAERI